MRLLQLIKQLGVINACLYLSNKLGGRHLSFIKYYFIAQPIDRESILPKGRGEQFQIYELPTDTEATLPSIRPDGVISERYAQGAICLATYKGAQFAGYLWYVKSCYKEDEVNCLYELPSRSVWDFDVYVEPKFRLSPVFLKLWDEAKAKLSSEGYNWTLSRISAFNTISLASHKRMGAKIIGWAVFIRSGIFQLTIASIYPYIHISCSKTSFPTFKFPCNP